MSRPMNAYERGLNHLHLRLVEMGEKVGHMIHLTTESLVDQDVLKAKHVIAEDQRIDDIDYEIERRALELLSLQQPTEKDLRYLMGVMRANRDLERVADYCGDIAEITIKMKQLGSYFKPLVDLPKMGYRCEEMLQKVVLAFAQRDERLARDVRDMDDLVDDLFEHLQTELIARMKEDPAVVDQSTQLALASRYYERIGDHIVNVSKMVIYVTTGERHPFRHASY